LLPDRSTEEVENWSFTISATLLTLSVCLSVSGELCFVGLTVIIILTRQREEVIGEGVVFSQTEIFLYFLYKNNSAWRTSKELVEGAQHYILSGDEPKATGKNKSNPVNSIYQSRGTLLSWYVYFLCLSLF
jgi:hypothetical protein